MELGDETTKIIKKIGVYKRIKSDLDIKIPFFAVNGEKNRRLTFYEDLIGDRFELSKQTPPEECDLYYDQDKVQKIDVKKGDEFIRSEQTKLPIVYDFKDFSKDDLLYWLDKKVLRKEYSQNEKRVFFSAFIDFLINDKKWNISELSINCHKLKSIIENHIDELEEKEAKVNFDQMLQDNKINLDNELLDLPEEIRIDNIGEDVFNNHLYEMAGTLNSEERTLALKIDGLDNILWWYRSPEKKNEAIYLQGWKRNKFYPDFIVKTKKGNYILTEYKGKQLLTNEDTVYKKELGKKWEQATPSNYTFELIDKDGIEEFITKIQSL